MFLSSQVKKLSSWVSRESTICCWAAGVGADGVAEDVVGGEAEGEQIGDVRVAELLAGDEGVGEVEFVVVGGGAAADEFVEIVRRLHGIEGELRKEGLACSRLGDFAAGVEGGGPVGQLRHDRRSR